MSNGKIIVVDDDNTTAKVVKLQLTNMGYSVVAIANSAAEAIAETKLHSPDLLLMDIKLGKGMDGIEAAEIIMEQYQTPVIYLTAYADEEILARALATNPLGYVNKPLRKKDLVTTISLAFEQIRERKRENDNDAIHHPDDNWQMQLTADLEGNVSRLNTEAKKRLDSMGFSNIAALLPDENLQHINTCVKSRRSRLVTEKHGSRLLSFEYNPTTSDHKVRIQISSRRLSKMLAEHKIHQNILLEALDHLATGIVLINENLNIYYANKSAETLIDAGDCILSSNGCLTCFDPEYTAGLHKIVLDGNDQTLSINRGDKLNPLYLLVTPLQTHKRNYGKNMPTNIVFVFESVNSTERIEDVIRSLYNLSPSEAKIAACLILTPNLEQVAESLGITHSTVRTHLKHIYSKTHTNRLSSLLHMLVTGPVGVILQASH
jgi:DNA-binding NarL/FixJ family response regulator